jgi:hypothetical protein
MTKEQELVCVHSCQGWDLAQIYKSKLEAMGIPVLLKYDSASLVFGITVDSLGQVRVMVPQAYASAAEAMIEVNDPLPEDNADDVQEQDYNPQADQLTTKSSS